MTAGERFPPRHEIVSFTRPAATGAKDGGAFFVSRTVFLKLLWEGSGVEITSRSSISTSLPVFIPYGIDAKRREL